MVQHGEEDRSLDGKSEATIGEKFVQYLAALGIAPQPLEQQWRADPLASQIRAAAVLKQRQDHRALRQTSGAADETVEIAVALNVFLAAEIADDALLDPAIFADGFD